MKQLFASIFLTALLALVFSPSANASFRLNSEVGPIWVDARDVCLKEGIFQLKSGTTEVCTDANYKHDCVKTVITPTRPQEGRVTSCAKWRYPKGSSPICQKVVYSVKTLSREVVEVTTSYARGAKNPKIQRTRITIADCE